MILGTEQHKPREIGGRYMGVWVNGELYPDQPFIVLREVTLDEWIAGRPQEEWEPEMPCDPSEALFYEVSID